MKADLKVRLYDSVDSDSVDSDSVDDDTVDDDSVDGGFDTIGRRGGPSGPPVPDGI